MPNHRPLQSRTDRLASLPAHGAAQMTPRDLAAFLTWMLDHGFSDAYAAADLPEFWRWYQFETPRAPTVPARAVLVALTKSRDVEKLRQRCGNDRTVRYRVIPPAAARMVA